MAEETANLPDRDQLLASIIAGATARTEAGELTWSHGTYGDTFRTKVNGLNVSVSPPQLPQTSPEYIGNPRTTRTIRPDPRDRAGPDRAPNTLHGLARHAQNAAPNSCTSSWPPSRTHGPSRNPLTGRRACWPGWV